MSYRLKVLLLLLLSLTSVFFAEVISGSSKFFLYDVWGWIAVIPLYGLHTIVLLYIITTYVGNKKILFSTLYFAGVLFGLYEAYLTKVLWVGLTEDPIMFVGISVMDFIVLVFLWHPIFSFIIPSLVFEGFMTNSNNLFEGLPIKFKNLINNKKNRIIIFVIIGLFLSFNSLGPTETLLSGFGTAFPILLIYYLLRKKDVHRKYSLNDVLPTKKQFVICILLLITMYLIMGLAIVPEVMTFYNQLSIWVLYLLFGFVFYLKLKHNKKEDETISKKIHLKSNGMVIYLIIIVLSGTIFITLFWLLGIQNIVMVITWILWMVLGMYLLVYSLFR